MKTNFYIYLFACALMVAACAEDDITNEFVPDDLSGKVVFQEVSTRTLQMADINSMNHATSFDFTLSQTRPVWSQDGSKFAAIELSGLEPSVFSIKIVDTEDESTTTWEIAPSTKLDLPGPLTWSPDGSTIAFLASPYNTIIYLDIQNGDTIQTKLSGKISGGITALAWHPDGDIGANVMNWTNYEPNNDVWMLEPFANTLKKKVSENVIPAYYGFKYIDWNREGNLLLLSTDVHHNEICVLDYVSGKSFAIPNIRGMAPCWSPDGKYLMYTGVAGHHGWDIIPGLLVSDTEGSFEKILYTDAGYSDWY